MPLAFAHPAAVLPLARLGLPLGALVAGALSPDAVLLLAGAGYDVTHSRLGVVTVDPLIALAGLAVWSFVVRDRVMRVAPSLQPRVAPRAGTDRRAWLLAPVAAVVGAATHVFWDSATHEGEWVVERVGWLQEQHGPLPGYAWAQHTSTVVGGLVVVAYVVRRARKRRAESSA